MADRLCAVAACWSAMHASAGCVQSSDSRGISRLAASLVYLTTAYLKQGCANIFWRDPEK